MSIETKEIMFRVNYATPVEEDKKIVSIIRIMYARRDWINLLKTKQL